MEDEALIARVLLFDGEALFRHSVQQVLDLEPDLHVVAETDDPSAVPDCPKCQGAMWDNRENKRNPRAPDFKCKDAACGGVIWPPRDPNAPDAGPRPPSGAEGDPACPVCGGRMWDDRESKRNPRAPDFKCRDKPKYQGGPGCPGVIWPPREGEAPRKAAAPAAG